jgi:hypothetical protein
MAAQKKQYRVRFVHDPDGVFEESNGERRALTAAEYAESPYMRDDRKTLIPYAEYLRYYGNPDRHVFLQSEVEARCPCCGEWHYVAGTGGIDFMDDNPELDAVDRWWMIAEIDQIPGHLRSVALEDLSEAGAPIPRRYFCALHGCRYFHVAESKYCDQHNGKGKAKGGRQ